MALMNGLYPNVRRNNVYTDILFIHNPEWFNGLVVAAIAQGPESTQARRVNRINGHVGRFNIGRLLRQGYNVPF